MIKCQVAAALQPHFNLSMCPADLSLRDIKQILPSFRVVNPDFSLIKCYQNHLVAVMQTFELQSVMHVST